MALAKSAGEKQCGLTNDWKRAYDSALQEICLGIVDKAHTPIYRRKPSPGIDHISAPDPRVEVAAKALAALWGTRSV